nr:TIGR03364 family FAD-dependent oxidoreductase [Rubrobacter tropicus]
MSEARADVAVVGAGIVGLAHALAAAKQGLKVVVFERSGWAVGASVRNFGLVWPVGQPGGHLYERALRSRGIWREVAAASGIWCAGAGSLHLAYHEDELAVLEEYLETTPSARDGGCELVSRNEVAEKSPAARTEGLRGALWSPTELNVDPRQAIPAIASLLASDYGVEFRFGTAVRGIEMPVVETTAGDWTADRVFVCGGEDFETLYPEVFAGSGITRCRLQMLRTVPQPGGWRLGPALCSGLTLLHYDAFEHCEGLEALRRRFDEEMPFAREKGVHVLLSQTARGELTIGDSHDYGLTHDPFASEKVDREIMNYLETFASVPSLEISERWQGTYPHLEDGSELVSHPEPGVTVVNGLGGAGMTLSFGLAEENLRSLVGQERSV